MAGALSWCCIEQRSCGAPCRARSRACKDRPRRISSSSRLCRGRSSAEAVRLAAGAVLLAVGAVRGAASSSSEIAPHVVDLRSWDVAYGLAEQKVAELTVWEMSRLIRGLGWHRPFDYTPGFYVGNVAGIHGKGIPWLKMQDSSNGFRTMLESAVGTSVVWPSSLAAACTWDHEMVEQWAVALGREFRGKEANVILGPAVNVHRITRGGRNFEYLSGEDPYLGARLARAFVSGVQSQGVMAVVKHFAFNEQETNRNLESSEVDDRTAWELYYPPFEAAVDAGAGSFMCSYNKVNGTYTCSNSNLLKRDLKDKMGFRGFVMSDWGATHSTALLQGNDMDQPGLDSFYSFHNVEDDKESLRAAVTRILAAMFRLRLDGQAPGCTPPLCFGSLNRNVTSAAHVVLARKLATASVVLLKNHGSLLPVNTSRVKRIGILGRAADAKPAAFDPHMGLPRGDYYSGGGSGHIQGTVAATLTVLDAIRARAAKDGIEVLSAHTTSEHSSSASTEDLLDQVDLVVVVAGAKTSEGQDRSNLNLDDEADRLIARAAKAKPTAVLMMLPGAVLMPWQDMVHGIATMFYGGQETGAAFAAVLFGDANPAAKLPIGMPKSHADVIEPGHKGSVPYAEGLATSYRDSGREFAYPFGHGLSYTTFRISNANSRLSRETWQQHARDSPTSRPPGAPGLMGGRASIAQIQVTVENTGARTGAEVVQVYLEFPNALSGTPKLQLRAFQKTTDLAPGSKQTLDIHLSARDLSTYTPAEGWRVHDSVVARLGSSSEDLRLEVNLSLGKASLVSEDRNATQPGADHGHSSLPMKPQMQPSEANVTETDLHHVHGPSPLKPLTPPSEKNNWILWLLQPLLLIILVLITMCATAGVVIDDDGMSSLPEQLQEAEMAPLVTDFASEGRPGPL